MEGVIRYCVCFQKEDFFPFLKNDVKLDVTPLRMQKIFWTRLNARRFTLYEFGATKTMEWLWGKVIYLLESYVFNVVKL